MSAALIIDQMYIGNVVSVPVTNTVTTYSSNGNAKPRIAQEISRSVILRNVTICEALRSQKLLKAWIEEGTK